MFEYLDGLHLVLVAREVIRLPQGFLLMNFVIAEWLSSRVRVIMLEIVVLPVAIRHIVVISIHIVVVGVCSFLRGCLRLQDVGFTPPRVAPRLFDPCFVPSEHCARQEEFSCILCSSSHPSPHVGCTTRHVSRAIPMNQVRTDHQADQGLQLSVEDIWHLLVGGLLVSYRVQS